MRATKRSGETLGMSSSEFNLWFLHDAYVVSAEEDRDLERVTFEIAYIAGGRGRNLVLSLDRLQTSTLSVSLSGSYPYWAESVSGLSGRLTPGIKLDVYEATLTSGEPSKLYIWSAWFEYNATFADAKWTLDGVQLTLDQICDEATYKK